MKDTILLQEENGKIEIGTVGNMNGNDAFTLLLATLIQLSIVNGVSEKNLLDVVHQGYQQTLDGLKES